MGDVVRSGRRDRAPLNRGKVLAAALAIADDSGLQAVTMRRLGTHLGVEAMSLYKHISGKGEILDAIVDLVIGEIDLPEVGADWRTGMRVRAGSARRVLSRHPWAIGMMESRTAPGPNALRYADAVIGSLRAAGFSVRMAAHAFVLLDSFVYGFVVQEVSLPVAGTEGLVDSGSEVTGSFPHLVEMAASHAAGPGYDFDEEFEFGLELILGGLEALRS